MTDHEEDQIIMYGELATPLFRDWLTAPSVHEKFRRTWEPLVVLWWLHDRNELSLENRQRLTEMIAWIKGLPA